MASKYQWLNRGNNVVKEFFHTLKGAKVSDAFYSSEVAYQMSVQLKECEQAVGEHAEELDPDLVNDVVTLLHTTVTESTPGVLTTEGREASAQLNLIVLDGLWNLLNTFYNQVPMKPLDSSWYGEELECLLLSVKLYSNTHLSSTFSNDSVQAILKIALQQIHNCLSRVKDFSAIDQDEAIGVLKSFLQKPGVNEMLRILSMMDLSLLNATCKAETDVLPLITKEDAEYLARAFTEGEFTTIQLLNLLKALSILKKNVSILKKVKILDKISDVFNSDDDTEEQMVAACLIESFLSDEDGNQDEKSAESNEQKSVLHTSTQAKIEKAPHIEQAKAVKLKTGREMAGNPLTFQVSCLEELVFLTGYDIAICVGEAEEISSSVTSEQRSLRICLALNSLIETITQSGSVAVHRIMSVPYCLDTICIFMRQHWHHVFGARDEGCCSQPFCNEIANLAGMLATSLSDESQLAQETIVQWGLVLRLAADLSAFSKEPDFENQDMQLKIQQSLFIIQNTSAEAEKRYVFHRHAETIAKYVLPYSKAQNPVISFGAKVILLHLGVYLSENSQSCLILSDVEIEGLINGLYHAVNAKDYKAEIFGGISSAYEIVSWLVKSTICNLNVELMLQKGIIQPAFLSLLKVPHLETSVIATKLLWILVRFSPVVKEKIRMLAEIINHLKKCSNSSFISKLALNCIQSVEAMSQDELLVYAEGCYDHEMYEECILSCSRLDKVSSLQSEKKGTVKLLLGKAFFQVYRKELMILENTYETYHAKELREKESSCYDKVHQTIKHLFDAHKLNTIDVLGSTYLDIAMMDIIRGVNELNKVSHCMLCLKREKNLRRSHVVPKSILGVFREGFVQHHGDKGLTISGVLSSKALKYHSEGTITKFMLCGACEMLLSVNGEEGFSKHFFSKLYDPLDQNCLKAKKELPYDTWLYHFCIGLLFRIVTGFIGVPYVANHGEIYSFIKICRSFLLNGKNSEYPLPSVYLLTNPVTIPMEYKNVWVHEALVEPAFFQLKTIRLSSGVSCFFPEVHFLIAHIGILNLIIKFSPAEDVKLPDEMRINPTGGVYVIPADEERLNYLPGGVKEVFTEVSGNIREEMKEFLFRREKDFPPEVSKSGENHPLKDAVGLVSAINADYDVLIEQSLEKQTNLNTLPASFCVDHSMKMVSLPPNYKLLIHSTIGSEETKITLFVGVKAIKKVDTCQPFVIFYQLSPTGIVCGGCLVSVDDCSIKEFIGGIPLQKNPQIFKGITKIAESIPDVLPIILKPKGFSNLKGLVEYFQLSSKVVKTFDTRCLSEKLCWFCNDTCNCCMDLAAAGVFSFTCDGQKLQFCGKKCSEYFIGPDIPLQVTATLFKADVQDPVVYHCDEYWKLFKILAYARSSGKGVIFSLDVFKKVKGTSDFDSSQCIAHYHLRQIFSQQFKTFNISLDGTVSQLSQSQSNLSQAFTSESPYYEVENYLLEACKLLFKCHEKMMDSKSEETFLHLDCTEKTIVKLNQVLDVQFDNEVRGAITTINSYRIISEVSDKWSMKMDVQLIQHLKNLEESLTNVAVDMVAYTNSCVENLIDVAYTLLAEKIPCIVFSSKTQLQCMLIVTVWKLIQCLNKKFPYLLQTSKSRQSELSASITAFVGFLYEKEEANDEEKAKEAVVFHILQQLTVFGNADSCAVASALEPFLVNPGDRRWLSLIVLYSVVSSLTEHQIRLVMLKEYDMPYLMRYFTNCPDLKDMLTFISCVLTLPGNKKLLLDYGMPDLIASILCESSTEDEVQHLAACLIEDFCQPTCSIDEHTDTGDRQRVDISVLCAKIKKIDWPCESAKVDTLHSDKFLEQIHSDLKLLNVTDIKEAGIEEKGDLIGFECKVISGLLEGLFTSVHVEHLKDVLLKIKTSWQLLMAALEDTSISLNSSELSWLTRQMLISLSRCNLEENLSKEILAAFCDVLHMVYQLVKMVNSITVNVSELDSQIVEALAPTLKLKGSIVRLWALLILSSISNESTRLHLELLSVESEDVSALLSLSAEEAFHKHVVCFTDQMSFSVENCIKFSEGGLLELLGQLMEDEEGSVDTNIAILVEKIMKKASCNEFPK